MCQGTLTLGCYRPYGGRLSGAEPTGVNQPEADDLSIACFAHRTGSMPRLPYRLMSQFAPS